MHYVIFLQKDARRQIKISVLNAKIYTDYKEMCAAEDIDVVHVCTPNPLHCEMTIYAFEHGKDVYCEKPLACTYADAQKCLNAQKKAGKKLTKWYTMAL